MQVQTITNTSRRFEVYYEQTGTFIGQGAFAQVFLAKRRSSGEMVAVKISNRNCAVSQKEKEILSLLSRYSHPQVVSILDIFDQGQILYIVQEYCVGGTLYDHMIKFPSVPENQAVDIIMQVSEGLNFLHNINIVHRDIKPENVLKQISKDGKEQYKITDFGLSSNREKMMTTKIGTAYYVAPEILDGRAELEGYDKSVDIWAMGLMFDELLHGTPFYNGATEDEVFLKIRNEPYFIRNKDYRQASFFESTKFIIQQVLINAVQRDPTRRKELAWVVDQLSQYKQIRRKSISSLENTKKSNKQLFTESQEKSPLAEDLLEFLSGNFPVDTIQQDPKNHIMLGPLQSLQLQSSQSPQLQLLQQQSQKIQLIQQKYSNTNSNNSIHSQSLPIQSTPILNQNSSNMNSTNQNNQHQNNLIVYDKVNYPLEGNKNIWDINDIMDHKISLCGEHGLPLTYRMPIKNEQLVVQIMSVCSKCIQMLGVYEGDTLPKLIDEATMQFVSKRFEHFYKAQDVEARAKQMITKIRLGELEIRENTQLMQQYSIICDKYENEGRAIFQSRLLGFEKFKARNYTGDDNWITECLLTKRVGQLNENIFIVGMRRTMQDMGNRAVEDCRKILENQLKLMFENLKRKLEL